MRLDHGAEGEAEHGCGNERDDEVRGEALRAAIAREPDQNAGETLAVLPDDRQHCAGLNDDLEHLALGVVHAQQVGREDQVTGGGDRQKLGESFDDPEYEGCDERHLLHGAAMVARG